LEDEKVVAEVVEVVEEEEAAVAVNQEAVVAVGRALARVAAHRVRQVRASNSVVNPRPRPLTVVVEEPQV